MDFKKMNSFISLAETGSFSKAADMQFMAQSTFSAQIRSLEEELGVSLVNRDNRREVSLTEEGKLFLDYSRRMLEEHELFLQKLHDLSKKRSLHIGLFYGSRLDRWTQLIANHNAEHDDCDYSIIFSYGQEKVDQLLSRKLDIALSARSALLDKEGLNYRHVFYNREAFGIPFSHPLAGKADLSIEDFRNEKIHCIEPGRTPVDTPYIRKLIDAYGFKKENFIYEHRIGNLHFVTKTKGEIILMPSQLMPNYIHVFPLNDEFLIDYGWYYYEPNEDIEWVLNNLK